MSATTKQHTSKTIAPDSATVPQGYKRTEVGVIPNDWDQRSLGELAITVSSGTSRTGETYGEFPIHGSTGVIGRSDHFDYEGPGILVARVGANAGRLNVVSGRYGVTDNTILIRLKPDCHLPFIWRQLELMNLNHLVFGSGQPLITGTQIKALRVAEPPGDEQRAIAEALSDVDGLLGALEALIAKKRAIKQAAMQQLLTGKTRLPGFSGPWRKLNMARDSVLKARIGWQGLTTSEYLSTGDYFLVTGTDFVGGRVDWATCRFVDRNRFIQDRNIQLAVGDVLLTKDGTIGKAGFVDSLPRPATLNSGVFVIRPKASAYVPVYMYYVLTSRIFEDFLARLQAGSTISHLYQKDFVGFGFNAPEIDEQTAIATVLSDMDAEIAALKRRRDKTRAIKQGMMQQLLTGRVRLL